MQALTGGTHYYALGNDISLSGNFTPIGTSSNAYTGGLEGFGHTISGLSISSSAASEVGLFTVIGGGAVNTVVENLSITGASVTSTATGGSYVGILAGGVFGAGPGVSSLVNNVAVAGSVTAGNTASSVGGLT